MTNKLLLALLVVAGACAIARAGYEFGRYLKHWEGGDSPAALHSD